MRNAMLGWALGTGDPDVLIEAHSFRQPLPDDVLEIALALDRVGRVEEAIAWARRGLADWGDRPRQVAALREFLADKLRANGEERAAADLFWQAFVSAPSLSAYRRLLGEDEGTDWLGRCGGHLFNSLAHAPEAEAGIRATPEVMFGALASRVSEAAVALVEILLYEGRIGEAWKAACEFGARSEAWMTLARAREPDCPTDAVAVYEQAALAIIARKDAKQYHSAVDLMVRICRLAESAGKPERFAALLERTRTEHRPKRKLQSLLDAQGW